MLEHFILLNVLRRQFVLQVQERAILSTCCLLQNWMTANLFSVAQQIGHPKNMLEPCSPTECVQPEKSKERGRANKRVISDGRCP